MATARPWGRLAAAATALAAVTLVLWFGLSIGATDTPPLGAFLNPYEGFYRSNDAEYYLDIGDLPGLRAPVELRYDERLVPHLYASTPGDLYYAQGYVQAQHRLFQLDLTARSAAGRLSEVLGARTAEFDRARRRVGGHLLARDIAASWADDPAAAEAVERYAAGVNAYIASLRPVDYPVEYKLLDFAPEPWSPEKTALVAVGMAYTLNYNQDDIGLTRAREILGARAFESLYPVRDPEAEPVIPPGTRFDGADTALLRASDRYRVGERPAGPRLSSREPEVSGGPHDRLPSAERGVGSNNWAVAPARTSAGNALLANDPHLGLTLPSIWFESELHTGGVHVHGVSLPGVPGITIGFNEHAAWGVTNVGMDVLDWHEVPAATPREIRVERIEVRDAAPVIDSVVVTPLGPVVVTDPDDARYGLALEWLTLKRPSGQAVNAFLSLNRARDTSDFLAASRAYEWPAQNMVFASDDGDIALRVSGTLPRRLPGEGRTVMAAGTPRASGFLDDDANPYAVNPPQGYLASTNQVSTDATYPYYYSGGFDAYRSKRINELLRGADPLTIADMAAFQLDDYSAEAAELAPVLLRLVGAADERLSLTARGQAEALRDWDFRYGADAFAPVIYEHWVRAVRSRTWDELSSRGGEVAYPETYTLRRLLAEDPLNRYFDDAATPERESAVDIAVGALNAVADRVDSLSRVDGYSWAEYNRPRVDHLLRIGAFSSGVLESVGGRAGTLNAQRGSFGPSWRMIVELGEPARARVVYPGGQSGRPGHPHYDDMLDEWAAGDYFPVRLTPPAELGEVDWLHRVTLTP